MNHDVLSALYGQHVMNPACPQGAPTSAVIVGQVNLTRTPSLAGHSVFFAVGAERGNRVTLHCHSVLPRHILMLSQSVLCKTMRCGS